MKSFQEEIKNNLSVDDLDRAGILSTEKDPEKLFAHFSIKPFDKTDMLKTS